LGLFDTVVAFDMVERRAAILACNIDPSRSSAEERASSMAARLTDAGDLAPVDWSGDFAWTPDWQPDAYRAKVERIRDYIRAGDIYQANFTQRWTGARP